MEMKAGLLAALLSLPLLFVPKGEALAVGATQKAQQVDPIVTGLRVSAEERNRWQAARQAYLECPKCVNEQPFPGDDESAAGSENSIQD